MIKYNSLNCSKFRVGALIFIVYGEVPDLNIRRCEIRSSFIKTLVQPTATVVSPAYRPHFSGFQTNIELSDLMAVIYIAGRELSN
jgi:hypothetical protein